MNPAIQSESSPNPDPSGAATDRAAGAVIIGLFIVCGGLAALNRGGMVFGGQGGVNAALVVLGFLASVVAFAPVLPWPNVLLAGGLAAFCGGLMEAISAVTGYPLGQVEFTLKAGPMLLGLIPWWLPLTWAAIALSARGAARLILHRSRQHPVHGYRVIGLAAVLAAVTACGLELMASRAAQVWVPGSHPVLRCAGLFLLPLSIQIAMTPLLMDKFPGQRPPNFRPFIVWASASLICWLGGWLA